MVRNFRRLVAYHEAGHAVVARKLGVEIGGIDMTPDDENDRLAVVQTRSAFREALLAGDRDALARDLYTALMVTLGGMTAEKVAGYPAVGFGHDEDSDNAINYALHLARIEAGLPIEAGPDELQEELTPDNPLRIAGEAIIERAEVETTALLKNHWQAVVRVAGALGKRDQVTPVELDHIIAHGQRGRQ